MVNAKAMLELGGFPPDQLQKDMEAYQAVTLKECNEAAKKYLDLDNTVIVIVGSDKQFDIPLDSLGPVFKVSMEIKYSLPIGLSRNTIMQSLKKIILH